ncbi:MAG: rod shape-determining protein MreD [Nitrospinae bacterium]|nr:rod shape-determining protein MreD [Nitrospinota bacterium]
MRTLFFLSAVLVVLIAQTTAFHFTGGYGIWPDLALVISIYAGLKLHKLGGLKTGLAAGFLEDMLSYGSMGTNTISKTLCGFAVGKFREKYINDSPISRIALTLTFSIIDVVLYKTLTETFAGVSSITSAWKMGFFFSLLNVAFALPVMGLLEKAEARFNNLIRGTGGRYGSSPFLD